MTLLDRLQAQLEINIAKQDQEGIDLYTKAIERTKRKLDSE